MTSKVVSVHKTLPPAPRWWWWRWLTWAIAVLSTAIGSEELADLAEMARTELLLIDADTTTRQLTKGGPLERRLAAGF